MTFFVLCEQHLIKCKKKAMREPKTESTPSGNCDFVFPTKQKVVSKNTAKLLAFL